jgi:hypothetical protein
MKQARWTIGAAAPEFGVDPKTLSGRIKKEGITPGDDGKFSTLDICKAIYTDAKAADRELKTEQAEFTRIKKLKLADTLVERGFAQKLWDNVMIACRQKVQDATIPEDLKQGLIRELISIPVDDYIPKDAGGSGVDAEEEPEPA